MGEDRKNTPIDKYNHLGLWDLSGLGVEFAFIFVGAVLLGNYIDEKIGWTPVFIILFSIGGFATAIYHMLRRISILQNTVNKEK